MNHEDQIHLPGPSNVPPQLTAPSAAFKRHAWLAGLGLVAFVAVYGALTWWLGFTIYRFIRDGLNGNLFIGILQAFVPSLMFFVLLRGLMAVKRGKDPNAVEILPSDEPKLFAFLYEIADRVGAPRPHRVFLTSSVQAGVAFDLSVMNLLFPTKKNLLLGLGLINVLTVSEFGAVLAHEFGHFAQRTMAVGRWVYMAEQIAGHIALHRGKLDRGLETLSVQDPRIAWIGWVLRLCLWSVRSVLDTVFLLVTMVHRALSREMELQADLVAASVSGSDALVHALHKTHSADQSYGAAFDVLVREFHKGALVKDLFSLQSRHTENIRRVCDDPSIGIPPPLPAEGRENHRVFPAVFAQPSMMWSTHPPDREREDNLKRVYLACPLDDREAWALLRNPTATREQVTANLLKVYEEDLKKRAAETAKAQQQQQVPPPAVPESRNALPTEEAVAKIDAIFQRAFHSPMYRGVYLGRDLTRIARTVDDLFDRDLQHPDYQTIPSLSALYPQEQRKEIEAWRQVVTDYHTLKGLLAGRLKKAGRTVRFRGEEVSKEGLPPLLERVEKEKTEAEQKVASRDRYQRTIHQRIATDLGHGWDAYHRGLVALVHYTEHTAADISDVDGFVANVIAVITADGHVSQSEMAQLQAACVQAFDVLAMAFSQAPQVHVPPRVMEKLCKALNLPTVSQNWVERLGPFTLTQPYMQSLGQWLAPAQTWFRSVAMDFAALADAAVEELLETEALLREMAEKRGQEGFEVPAAAEAPRIPASYVTLQPGGERKRQDKLGLWERFMISDGFFPGALRFGVASAILGGLAVLSHVATDHKVYVHNGLSTAVTVQIANESMTLGGHESRPVALGTADTVNVRVLDSNHRVIEQFTKDVSNSQATYVYNIARASLLYRRTYIYRLYQTQFAENDVRTEILGNDRWIEDRSSERFAPPPRSVSIGRGQSSTSRTVIDAADQSAPMDQVMGVRGTADRLEMIRAHVANDAQGTEFPLWLSLAARLPDGPAVLAARANREHSLSLWIAAIRLTTRDARSPICAQFRQQNIYVSEGDAAYVQVLCTTDTAAQSTALRSGIQQHSSNPHFAWESGQQHVARGEWALAEASFEIATRSDDQAAEATEMIARVRRVQWVLERVRNDGVIPANFAHAGIGHLVDRSPELRALLSSEQPREDGEIDAVHWFARGELQQAVQSTRDPSERNAMLLLAACSDNATDSMQQEAMRLVDQDVPEVARVLPLVGLAVRMRGEIPAPLHAVAERVGPRAELQTWLVALKNGQQIEPPASLYHPMAVLLGVIVRGPEAPLSWRAEAMAFSFQSERPYFAVPQAATEGVGGLGVSGTFGQGGLLLQTTGRGSGTAAGR